MRKPLRFITILIAFQFFNTASFAQCGVTPIIDLGQGTGIELSFDGASSVVQPNWTIYRYEWFINDNPYIQSSTIPSILLPAGYNKVCLKTYATNSVTSDSCVVGVCNVFQSTGCNLYPQFEATVSGDTVTVNASYYGCTSGNMVFPTGIDFGDTSIYTYALSATHVYANPGDYVITFNLFVEDSVGGQHFWYTRQKVHVNNGNTNWQINGPTLIYSNCDSFAVNISSNPPFGGGPLSYVDIGAVTSAGDGIYGTHIQDNVPLGTSTEVPGRLIYRATIFNTSSVLYSFDKSLPIFVNSCNSIILDTIYGKVYYDADFDGLMDSNEVGIPNIDVGVLANAPSLHENASNYKAVTDANGNYSVVVPHGQTFLHLGNFAGYSLIYPEYNDHYSFYFNSGTGHYNYNWGLAATDTHISGTTFLDYNHDSIYNAGDKVFKSVTLRAHNNTLGYDYYKVSSDVNGTYQFDLPSGDYTIKPVYFVLDSAIINPDSITVNTTTGGSFTNSDFAFTSSQAGGNLGISLVTANPRPGFGCSAYMRVENTGIDTTEGTLVLSYDSTLVVNGASPGNGIVDNVNHTITWATGFMPATQVKYFTGFFDVPVSTPLGTILNSYCTIAASGTYIENNLANNQDSRTNVVVGSFDPNDKSVSPSGYGTSGDVHHNQRLHYRINFQNTGTASAINVTVQDEIDTDLDLNTFQMERASHNYVLVTSGRTITWKFLSIGLPDSTSDEPGSHGFIEYSILPVQGLPDATTIENDADIYFDFNSPVVTNTVVNTLQTNITGIELPVTKNELTVYPVPVKDLLMIQLTEKYKLPLQINLTDISGRIVKKVIVSETPKNNRIIIDVKSLSAGVYVMQLVATNDSQSWKIVKE